MRAGTVATPWEDEKVLPPRGSAEGGTVCGLAGMEILSSLGWLNPTSMDLENGVSGSGGVTARGASHWVEKG